MVMSKFCGAGVLARDSPHAAPKISGISNHWTGKAKRSAEGPAAPGFRGRVARATPTHNYPENDVPQPHDFDAFGLTNTNPCCIRVS